jgi:hypothetical protein
LRRGRRSLTSPPGDAGFSIIADQSCGGRTMQPGLGYLWVTFGCSNRVRRRSFCHVTEPLHDKTCSTPGRYARS